MTAFTIPYAAFHSALARVASAMSSEETRYYLCGVCLDFRGECLTVVATDGHRLHKVELWENGLPEGHPSDAILPAGFVKRLLTIKPHVKSAIEMVLESRTVSVDVQGCRMSADLIDGTYPDWRRVIPTEKATSYLALNVDYMIELLRSAKAGNAKELIVRACAPVGDSRHVEQPTVMNDASGGEYVLMPRRPDAKTMRKLETVS